MPLQPLVLYDIKREVSDKAEWSWSPNVWRTRLALNIKGIPYETKFLEFTEVAPTIEAYNIEPHGSGAFLNLKYSAPAIYDPNTNRCIMDSHRINLYLEQQYPETPQLYPPGTHSLQAAFISTNQRLPALVFPANIDYLFSTCSEADKIYYRKSREAYFGVRLEDIAPKGDALTDIAKELERYLDELAEWIDANGPNSLFFGGISPIQADVDTAAQLIFLVKTVPEDHELHKAFRRASNGRWVQYLDAFSKWTQRST